MMLPHVAGQNSMMEINFDTYKGISSPISNLFFTISISFVVDSENKYHQHVFLTSSLSSMLACLSRIREHHFRQTFYHNLKRNKIITIFFNLQETTL